MKKTKNKNKHKVITLGVIVVLALSILALVCGAAFLIDRRLQAKRNQPEQFNTENYIYHFPDWEENIWEDEDYMEKDCTIFFQNGAETYPLADVGDEGKGASFFADYINAIIKGDHEALNRMYTSEYTDKNGYFEPFTMQKVYNVLVSYKGRAEGIERYGEAEVFDLSYYIMKNNGTFRRDIPSDASRTQIVYLVSTDEGYKIVEVDYYKNREVE